MFYTVLLPAVFFSQYFILFWLLVLLVKLLCPA
uniref:Uncharacterized protein n=1 Tax=Anguilla anguilla TaxID=7936 RepID=A0A0E9UMS1_ANGAN